MSGHTERACTSRSIETSARRRGSQHRCRRSLADDTAPVQQTEECILRQQYVLSQWKDAARRIIKEISDASEETVAEVSPSELLSVIDYVKLMKSSVEIYQTINEALKQRVDELLHVSDRDGHILQSLLNYVQSLPVLHAIRDERTNEHLFQVNFSSARTLQVHASASAASETEEREGPGRRVKWLKRAVSAAAVCVLIGASVAKSGFSKYKQRT